MLAAYAKKEEPAKPAPAPAPAPAPSGPGLGSLDALALDKPILAVLAPYDDDRGTGRAVQVSRDIARLVAAARHGAVLRGHLAGEVQKLDVGGGTIITCPQRSNPIA